MWQAIGNDKRRSFPVQWFFWQNANVHAPCTSVQDWKTYFCVFFPEFSTYGIIHIIQQFICCTVETVCTSNAYSFSEITWHCCTHTKGKHTPYVNNQSKHGISYYIKRYIQSHFDIIKLITIIVHDWVAITVRVDSGVFSKLWNKTDTIFRQ